MEAITLSIVFIVVITIFIIRLLGAWMLRINEVITGINALNQQIKALNKHFSVEPIEVVSGYLKKKPASAYKNNLLILIKSKVKNEEKSI